MTLYVANFLGLQQYSTVPKHHRGILCFFSLCEDFFEIFWKISEWASLYDNYGLQRMGIRRKKEGIIITYSRAST